VNQAIPFANDTERPRALAPPLKGTIFDDLRTLVGSYCAGFARMLERVGIDAGFEWKVHPHMLRHAAGYKLANDGRDTRTIQDYMGHRAIASTVRYTELAATRFVGLWRD
jgi:integrase